jgi:hypothetical protein
VISRTRHVLVLLVVLLAVGVTATSAQAIIVSSQITTPAGTIYPLYNTTVESPAIAVAGTASGTAEVDIRCYYGAGAKSFYTLEAGVEVLGGAFSTTVQRSTFEEPEVCRMRAVPTGTEPSLPPGQETEFKGPLVAPGYFSFGSAGFTADSTSLGGGFFVESTRCGIESALVNATTLEESEYVFYCNGGLLDRPAEPEAKPAPIIATVDGTAAYEPEEAEFINHLAPGLPRVTIVSSSYNESSGDMSVTERVPFVRCEPEPNAAPSGTSCSSFADTGVAVERTWTAGDSDHVATLTDVWRSTNGAAHQVNIDYFNEFRQQASDGGFLFPGTTTFSGTTPNETVALPAGPGTILYKNNLATPEAGNGIEPQGAIVYDRAPSGGIVVTRPTTEENYDIYDAPYTFAIPAGGTSDLRMAFIQGYSMEEVRAQAAKATAGFAPTISIGAPANGTTLESESPTVTVSGTAADSGALASVSVDGSPASLTAGGAWSATATLKPGANTITATATDQAGLTATATVTVDYKIPPGKATLAGPITTNNGNVTFTLKCTGASGAVCTVKDSLSTIERRHKSKLLGLLAKITKKTVTVASGKQTIAAGKQLKITLTLNKTGKALLKQFHKLPGKLTVTIATATTKPTTAIAKNITITPPKPKKKKHKH